MKPKAKKQILGVLAAVLVLIFFQLPLAPSSSGALYSSYIATQSISDPTGNTDGDGLHITQAFWASDGTYSFFRLDPLGPFKDNSDYEFYFDTGGNSPTSTAYFSNDTAAYILEWKVLASTNFPSGLGTWWGATSNMGGSLADITTPIPVAVWLFTLGVLALVALKRRKPTA
jgi:hypothetical protein